MSYQGIQDEILPNTVKPSLQQYDNYQTYDICCVDVWFETTDLQSNVTRSEVTKQLSFLAIQAYNTSDILCDFTAIATQYK
jgi:hypothetical protein